MGQTLRRCLGKSNAPHQNDFQSNLVRLDTNLDAYEENYIEGELLGEGITGCVKEVEHRKTGKKYAMKSINLDRVNKAQIKELKTEIEILKQLDHPNIVRLHEVYQNKSNIRIVMELLTGGDLSSRFLVDEEKIRNVVFQLVSACRYWHSRGVVHRDLKLENVLYSNTDASSDVKVIDFGLSATFFSEEIMQQMQLNKGGKRVISNSLDGPSGLLNWNLSPTENSAINRRGRASVNIRAKRSDTSELIGGLEPPQRPRRGSRQETGSLGTGGDFLPQLDSKHKRKVTKSRIFQTTCGTAFYMAPEIMFGTGYTEKCDLWAIGVLTYMLIARKPPFPGKDEREVFQKVRKCNPNYKGKAWRRMSPDAMEFVKHLLMVNPALRWTAEKALASPWLSSPNADGSSRYRRRGTSGREFELEVVRSMRKFAHYSRLKKAAMMIISHKQSDFQSQSFNHCFLAIDKSNKGYLSFEEVREFILARDSSVSEDEVIDIFNGMDQDSTGSIRYMEFLAASIETEFEITPKAASLAFDHLDTASTGVITMKSMQKLLGKGFSKSEIADIIKESDIKGDQKISKDEFTEIMCSGGTSNTLRSLTGADNCDIYQPFGDDCDYYSADDDELEGRNSLLNITRQHMSNDGFVQASQNHKEIREKDVDEQDVQLGTS
uniref:non-specific serine/threonine protein kinase n=1 Tax=Mucochytrium quahogii TaxID=96639 RepID=A0A7S2S447_9STRA|mmetsp:Transcript_24299/g.39404  ORF Transcript_24299/g.39404 Transcript_24299/m.39404 type:complete len:662 (-) Transcript_24299:1494-3479(-)|eukprot:CAMPEP_0203759500 /NCGR_PEP_ID=MMETSP0098-20131031/12554_1 /ASSEMBLY_ACC=CAM_ASM_000208 /TAXON_ID=96639 /ORGANISM=" , Strain NY0313808BC1" /LENGTH=661 /DNA_ID=CAMNT_0050652509 /DNA_START=296 /DNA_END=2281 /DNA_ORIENTATION=-